MTDRTNQQWRLASRPVGDLKDEDLKWHEEPVAPLADGQVLVRNVLLSLDPTNRIWMSDMDQYLPPVQIGEVMRGVTVGVVEESKNPGFSAGDLVSGTLGWQLYATTPADEITKLPKLPVPPAAFMGLLSHIGATAYFGLLDVAEPKEGETVVVSAAAGAVGSLVGQIAKIKGCRAIGIAGTDEKCRWLTEELGFDGAINYKTEDVGARLDALCPNGIDVNFENVGGKILDTILPRMNLYGRVSLCGMISTYNATDPVPGPYQFGQVLMKRLRIQGFIILDYGSRFPEAIGQLATWLTEGKIKYKVDTMEGGLKQAPAALRRLLSGGNIGKQVLQVSEAP